MKLNTLNDVCSVCIRNGVWLNNEDHTLKGKKKVKYEKIQNLHNNKNKYP